MTVDAATSSLVIQVTGDDGAERHLLNVARSTAPPGELIINTTTTSPCLVSRHNIKLSHVVDVSIVRRHVTTLWTSLCLLGSD